MPLRALLEIDYCTVQDFELASDERFWEGLTLLAAGCHSGGIYLLGYAAEMLLKNSCFRLDPTVRPSSTVDDRLAPARKWMKRRHPKADPEHFHSLMFWLQYLRSRRSLMGKPSFDGDFERMLIRSVRRISGIWWVEARYRPGRASPLDAQAVYDGVIWLRDNYPLLWR